MLSSSLIAFFLSSSSFAGQEDSFKETKVHEIRHYPIIGVDIVCIEDFEMRTADYLIGYLVKYFCKK